MSEQSQSPFLFPCDLMVITGYKRTKAYRDYKTLCDIILPPTCVRKNITIDEYCKVEGLEKEFVLKRLGKIKPPPSAQQQLTLT